MGGNGDDLDSGRGEDSDGLIRIDIDTIKILKDNEPNVVYFITDEGMRFCKIGYTRDIKLRIKQLQHANPMFLKVAHSIEVENESEAKKLEARMHKKFAGLRIQGEWFMVDGDLLFYLTS